MIDVFVISGLASVRAGLASVLGASGDLQVAGEASSLDAASDVGVLSATGVVLLDTADPEEIDDVAGRLEQGGPGLVVLGPGSGASRLLMARPTFPWAYLAREAAPDRIIAAVRAVSAGLVAVEFETAADVLSRSNSAAPVPLGDSLDDLTAREHEVLTLVAIGLTNKAIGLRLGISDHTVKFHVASLLAKLGAESRTEAVHLATRRGLLTL